MNKCIYSKYCGGCQYQGIPYSKQLESKQKNVDKLLKCFGKVKPIIGMDNPYNYRNKVQVSFGYDDNGNVICGNYVTSSHTIVPIDDCMICDEKALEIIHSIKKLISKYKISIFDENSLRGCLRHILIRTTSLNEYMVVLVTGSVNINKKDLFIKDIIKFNKDVKTIVQNINNKHTSMVLGSRNYVLYGKGYVVDELCGLKFRISASSFYQVNKTQTEVLYKTAIKEAQLNRNDIVIDAYCGTGTIGLVASKHCKEVLGIEVNSQAIKDAIINMKNNHIKNASFVCEDAGKYMNLLSKNDIDIDTVIMDPPRTGSDKKFMTSLIKLRPSKIVYVSCNPITLKDNLNYLTKYYDVNSIQPVDMFPFTNHVECVVSMRAK